MNEMFTLKHQQERLERKRKIQIIQLAKKYGEGKYKVSRQFDYEPSNDDIFIAATEIISAKYPGLVYKAYDLYLKTDLATEHELNDPSPSTNIIRNSARLYLYAVIKDKKFPLDPSFRALIEEATEFCRSIPPGVKISENSEFSSSINSDKLALFSQAIELLDSGISEDEVISQLDDIDFEDQPLDDNETSVGIEVEQANLNIDQIKAIDLLPEVGFRVEQDADREIIFPPSNSFRDTIKAWIVLRKLEIITDPEASIHVTLGGLEEPEKYLEDILMLEIIMNAVADFAFRSKDPALKKGESTSVSEFSAKPMMQGESYWFRGFPVRIKSSGLIEFRNIFTFDFSDSSFVKGMLILDALFQCLVDHSKSDNLENTKWQTLKSHVQAEIDAAYVRDGEDPGIEVHCHTYKEFINFWIWCDNHDVNLTTGVIIYTVDSETRSHFQSEFVRILNLAKQDPFFKKYLVRTNQKLDDDFNNQWSLLKTFYAYGREFRNRTTEILRMSFADEKQMGRDVYRAIKRAIGKKND